MTATHTLIPGKAMDGGEPVTIASDTSQRILICGKTGTGKSYTLGVLIEELARQGDDIVLVVDPQGIFWSMAETNSIMRETDHLWEYDRDPRPFRVNLLVPGDPIERFGDAETVAEMERRGIHVQELRLNPADLSPEMWCELFGLDISELQGSMLFRAVRECNRRIGRGFSIDDILAEVERAPGLDVTREAVARKLNVAQDWQIFEEYRYREIWEVLHPDAVNVLDLSVIAQGRYGLRNLVVAVLGTFIFRMRTIARRREALGLPTDVRKVWLAIDEAHNFCPQGRGTLAKETLIRWAKEGRQPGLSLIVASQQPAAIDPEILSQCGIRIVHRLTAKEDIRAVGDLAQDYLADGFAARLKRLTGPGQTLIIDDERERVEAMQIRPRQSLHGGGSA